MEVVFCAEDDKGVQRVAAFGELTGIEGNESLKDLVGQPVRFALHRKLTSLLLAKYRPIGIVSSTERNDFYQFEVVSGEDREGTLVVLGKSDETGCLQPGQPVVKP